MYLVLIFMSAGCDNMPDKDVPFSTSGIQSSSYLFMYFLCNRFMIGDAHLKKIGA